MSIPSVNRSLSDLNKWLSQRGRGNIKIVLQPNVLIKSINQYYSVFCCSKFNEAGKKKEIDFDYIRRRFYKVEGQIDAGYKTFPIHGKRLKVCPYCRKGLRVSVYDPVTNRGF